MARISYPVTIKKKELFYEVDAMTYGMSKLIGQAGTPQQSDALASETDVTLDKRLVSRFAENRYGNLKSLLVKFLADGNSSSGDNTLSSDTGYVFNFSVLDETTEHALASLSPLLHEYFVKGILLDWYTSKGSDKGNVYVPRLEAIERKLLELLYHREVPKATN